MSPSRNGLSWEMDYRERVARETLSIYSQHKVPAVCFLGLFVFFKHNFLPPIILKAFN